MNRSTPGLPSITNSRSSVRLASIESVMLSSHHPAKGLGSPEKTNSPTTQFRALYSREEWWRHSSQLSPVYLQFSRSVMSDSLRLHELLATRPPCPSPTPRVHPNPCPLSWWWTGRPGMLWFMELQRVGHDWATELNWAEGTHPTVFICRKMFHPRL